MDWQTVTSLIIVAGAFCILGMKIFRAARGGEVTGCGGGCSKCPASGTGVRPEIIQLKK